MDEGGVKVKRKPLINPIKMVASKEMIRGIDGSSRKLLKMCYDDSMILYPLPELLKAMRFCLRYINDPVGFIVEAKMNYVGHLKNDYLDMPVEIGGQNVMLGAMSVDFMKEHANEIGNELKKHNFCYWIVKFSFHDLIKEMGGEK